MFRKSLVLLCMVFGLNAWGNPPATISSEQLIRMIQGDTGIQEGHETWKLEESHDLLGDPVDEKKELMPFLKKLVPTHRTSPGIRHGNNKVEYTIKGTGDVDGTIYTVTLRKK